MDERKGLYARLPGRVVCSSPYRQQAGRSAGFHAEHILYVIDEASGVKDEVFEPILGAMSTKGARLLMCGNPTRITGFFYDSHHKSRPLYNAMHIDGRDSSRVDKSL